MSRPSSAGAPTAIEIGRRAAGRRLELGMSQAVAAKAAGMKRAQYGHFERGVRRISATKLAAIARVLKIGVEELLGSSRLSPAALELARIYDGLPSEKDRARLTQFAGALASSRRY